MQSKEEDMINYNKIALMSSLLPISMVGNYNDAAIKQLEDSKFKIEERIIELGAKSRESISSHNKYYEFILNAFNAPKGQDKKESFESFLRKTAKAFYFSKEIGPIISEGVFKKGDCDQFKTELTVLIVQRLHISSISERIKDDAQELRSVLSKLNDEKANSKFAQRQSFNGD